MINNIYALFSFPEFRQWLDQFSLPSFPIYYLRDLKPLQFRSDNTRIRQLTNILSAHDRIMARVDEIKKSEPLKRGASILAYNFLRGDGLIAERLLEPYEEDFTTHLLAGVLALEKEEEIVFSLDAIEYFIQQTNHHLDYLAAGEESNRTTAEQINNLVVQIITDPKRLISLEVLKSYCKGRELDAGIITGGIIPAYKKARSAESKLEKLEAVSKYSLAALFPSAAVESLLLGTKVNIQLKGFDREVKTLNISLISAVDSMYGQLTKPSVRDWIADALKRADVEPQEVNCIGPYPYELNLQYSTSEEIPLQQREDQLVTYLSNRFITIYDLAVLFTRYLEATTQFNTDSHPDLLPWKGRGLLPLTPQLFPILPILAALTDHWAYELIFRAPLTPKYHFIGSSLRTEKGPPWLGRIEADDGAIAIIVNLFLEILPSRKIWPSLTWRSLGLESPYTDQYLGLGFLRTKSAMLERLNSLTEEEESKLAGVNFFDYLNSMGYPDLQRQDDEYIGLKGLAKAIEIHSMEHLIFDKLPGGEWPFYYEELV